MNIRTRPFLYRINKAEVMNDMVYYGYRNQKKYVQCLRDGCGQPSGTQHQPHHNQCFVNVYLDSHSVAERFHQHQQSGTTDIWNRVTGDVTAEATMVREDMTTHSKGLQQH